MTDSLTFYQADIADCGQFATEARVMGIPDTRIYRGGEMIGQRVGPDSHAKFRKWIDETLAG